MEKKSRALFSGGELHKSIDLILWVVITINFIFHTQSGLNYTIIHPGGLIDNAEGTEQFVLDVDDKLLKNKKRSISRSEVANLCVAALKVARSQKVSFDCITREPNEAEIIMSAEEALKNFLKQGKTSDYSL